MQSHPDYDRHLMEKSKALLDGLKQKAGILSVTGGNQISAGRPGEEVLMEYTAGNGVYVRRLPDDEHGVLRVSIGGGDHLPVQGDYCVFRGKPSACLKTLRKALAALEEAYVSGN